MFKLNRHKSDRLGERVEFRFSSFQAFQIPKGWDRLILSLVSMETGKTIARANKASVRGGNCQWTETFSESIFIPHDDTLNGIEECALKIVVSMGSQRSGSLGEVIINLTDYLSSRDSGSLSLPLKKCNYGTILQVRIQCLNPKRGSRNQRSSNERPFYTNNDDADSKSDGSDTIFNRNFESSSSNHLGDERLNRDTSLSASGSHRSSDSGDSSVGKSTFSPKSNSNGGSYIKRQDSDGSHISATSNVGPTDDFSKSNPSSFNSRASGSSTPNHAIAPISLKASGSSKYLLEVAEETIEELQDEAKMWERHAQKLKLDIDNLKKDASEKSKLEAELNIELSAVCAERESLKQEIKQLKLNLEEGTTKQTASRAAKNEVMLRVQKELESEVKFLKESNTNLNLQLKKSQEANIELISIIEELEETVEKQRLEITNFPQQSPVSEYESEMLGQKLLDVEAEWASKLSLKEEEVRKLEEKLSGLLDVKSPSEKESSSGSRDLIEEIEILKEKVQELERDCSELTDENLELLLKMKESEKGNIEEKGSENFDSEVDFLKSRIHRLEDELSINEAELQLLKDQASDFNTKIRESQLEVEGYISELNEMKKKLDSKQNAGDEYEIENLSFKKPEIDDLRLAKEELEVLIANMQREKDQLEEKLSLLSSSVDSHVSTNKTLERKLLELEMSKNEVEIQVAELEEENVQLSERISGLEAQLRYLTDEKEFNRLELEDSKALVLDLNDEVARLQDEIKTQKGELKKKLIEAQKKLAETQEEVEYLKRSHSKLQSTTESLIEENSSLQKSNGDLRRKKMELHERCANLEVELSESGKRASGFLKKVEFLEAKLSSMQNDIVSKEKMLISQFEKVFQEHEDQEEKINHAKLMLNQLDAEKNVEVENLKREIAHLSSQLCATHDEREKMASDAVLEVSNLRSDRIKYESNLSEAQSKIKLYETELQSLKQESSKKVQGLVDVLNASKRSEEMLMSDINSMQRQAEAAKYGEEKFKKEASELELKLKAADYEKHQLMDEISSLKIQVQKIGHLQDEILLLKSSLEDAKFAKGKAEDVLHSVSEECEGLKRESILLTEKVLKLQTTLHDGEDERRSRIALEEKLLRLEGDLSAKEASCAHETELKNEINRIKRANSEYQRKMQCLEEEKCERMRKSQSEVQSPSGEQHEKQSQTQDAVQIADADQTKRMDDSKLHDLEVTIKDLEAKINELQNELVEAVETNNMYKIQLQGFMTEKQGSSSSEILKKSVSENNMGSQRSNKIASLEADLKEMTERYLNMSLQYAEVEAQREELVMKLKATTKGKGWFS